MIEKVRSTNRDTRHLILEEESEETNKTKTEESINRTEKETI